MTNPTNTAKATVLKLNSSGRKTGSVSRQLTDRVLGRLQSQQPQINIIERDLADGLPVVTEDWIGANFTPKQDRTDAQTALLSQSDALVAELHAADILLIGLPIYNFGVPAALKEWIDLIARAGETFRYTSNGPEGLLTGKRAIVTVASGGVPVGSPMDFATTYLTQVLNFIGITDITYVSATGLASDPDAAIKSAEQQIDQLDLARAA
ncbi:MAG: FMN-dependent NADH-azoreductase [Alphaproteobacteria bacterium]|nr:FMN-dependent NADH-azoreductase [Alphaproteobacteria bacterium]